ncbi:hypothetical protein [Kitasatospora sp. NPDC101183]|uniref:hypothetical protein n=1 Tax=Kitasatospora sp. NPDC101183 TaxID=3364100 RepID=UPI0037F99F74
MRTVRRTLAVSALTLPLVIGCAGLASATEGLDANWGQGFFTAGPDGSGVAGAESSVSPGGVSHADFGIWSDDSGVTGGFTGSGAAWTNG